MKKKQIVIIVAVVAVMGYLYTLPVKGLVKPSTPHNETGKVSGNHQPANNTTVNLEDISAAAKNTIGAGLSAKINELEDQLKKASDDAEKQTFKLQLAKQWDDVNQPAPAGFYYLDAAKKSNSFSDWLNAGNRFNDAFKANQDTAAQPAFLNNAVEAFENARKLQPNNLEAKTGLGVAYVNGGAPSPMQGISLLLEVVKQEPNNRQANLALGMFSMKSGQYAKAVERFKTVIAQKAEVEPYFYLAESYKQLGMKKEAIAAYEKCKEMIPDAAFGQRIDDFIKELKN
jgi:tetratricopeptide (TPR) repeat protein